MKKEIKRLFPKAMHDMWFNVKERVFLSSQPDRGSRFTKIYRDNMWKNPESRSGYGSTLEATSSIRMALEEILKKECVTSMLDIPCGDFNWMKCVKFDGDYIGADIVSDIVTENNKVFGTSKRVFKQLDLVADQLPNCDLVFCRECLNHLSLGEVEKGLNNLVNATKKIFIATHNPAVDKNLDQAASFRFRELNLTLGPLYMRSPDELIEDNSHNSERYLGVWYCRNGRLFSR